MCPEIAAVIDDEVAAALDCSAMAETVFEQPSKERPASREAKTNLDRELVETASGYRRSKHLHG